MASMGLLRAFLSMAHTPTTIVGSATGLPSSSASPGAWSARGASSEGLSQSAAATGRGPHRAPPAGNGALQCVNCALGSAKGPSLKCACLWLK